MPSIRVTVLGGGSFGTVLANLFAENGHSVNLWMRDAARAAEIEAQRENRAYLPGVKLHPGLEACADLGACLPGSDLVMVSVPSKAFRSVLRASAPHLPPQVPMVSSAKGIESDRFLLMSQVMAEEVTSSPIGVLSGPNLATEIAMRHPAASVIASPDESVQALVQDNLASERFRIYSAEDMYGVELAGALKNIYAIITGMSDALGLGANTRGMLITRSLAEMSRLAATLGANPLTFLGLAGVGDLVVTCTSPLSRNYRIGSLLAKGRSVEEAEREVGQVAEGVNTLRLVRAKADALGVYMPLVSGLHLVLEDPSCIDVVTRGLMTGTSKRDVEFAVPGLRS